MCLVIQCFNQMMYLISLLSIQGQGDGFFRALFSFLPHLTFRTLPEMLTFYHLFLQKLTGFKPSCLSACNKNTTPTADITRQSITKPPDECHVLTHWITQKKQSREQEKLHYKFSNGKQASIQDPGCSFLLEACCQRCLKATAVPVLQDMPGKGPTSPGSGEHAKSQYL